MRAAANETSKTTSKSDGGSPNYSLNSRRPYIGAAAMPNGSPDQASWRAPRRIGCYASGHSCRRLVHVRIAQVLPRSTHRCLVLHGGNCTCLYRPSPIEPGRSGATARAAAARLKPRDLPRLWVAKGAYRRRLLATDLRWVAFEDEASVRRATRAATGICGSVEAELANHEVAARPLTRVAHGPRAARLR